MLELRGDPEPLAAAATVRLTPCWIARLLGALVELVDLVATERWSDGEVRWRFATTGRDLRETRFGGRIREALERRAVSSLPAAIARSPRAAATAAPRYAIWPCASSAALGIALYELPPKRWQGASLGRAAGDRSKIEYRDVERLLIAFLADAGGPASEQLAAIPAG